MSLMTKEQYEHWINRLDLGDRNITPQWSQPVYICPKCGGGMCKNLWTCRSLAVMPPITEYEYRCDNEQCGNIEYLRGWGGLRMFVYIILLWILINMSAPAWTYVLLGIAAFITILKWEVELE